MSLPVQGLGSALCDVSPARIEWAQAAAKRLEQAGFEVSIGAAKQGQRDWFLSATLAFEPLRQPVLKGASGEELARILSAHEDVLQDVEQALGLAAEFSDYGPLDEAAPALTVSRDGCALGRVVVCSEVASTDADADADAGGGAVILCLAFNAARLSIKEAEALEGGDMLVLNHGPWPLIPDAQANGGQAAANPLIAPGMPPLGLDPHTGRLIPTLSDQASPDTSAGAYSEVSSQENPAALSVPVAIHLGDTAVTQAELARMAQTGTFDLGAVSEGLSAQLSVGGRIIGRGEIVRIGDRFAVLLDKSETAGTNELPSEGEAVPASEERAV
ncbi:MAG: hypothetical protein SXU28_07770 [Pseudomonadota bacterium]|nr:hypothetical protein [Pseudomonadota bacterium]